MGYRFKVTASEVNKDELLQELILLNTQKLQEEEEEEVVLKTLALIEGLIHNLSYKFAKKSSKTTYEDYFSEMVTAIIPKIRALKLKNTSSITQVVSYLYYWLNDACQCHYAAMEYATSISLSKAKKIAKSNDTEEMKVMTKTSSLNQRIKGKEKDVVEYHENFSTSDNVIILLYKRELKRLILEEFGEETWQSFIKVYSKGYKGDAVDRKRLAPLILKIQNEEDLKDMIVSIIESGKGFE